MRPCRKKGPADRRHMFVVCALNNILEIPVPHKNSCKLTKSQKIRPLVMGSWETVTLWSDEGWRDGKSDWAGAGGSGMFYFGCPDPSLYWVWCSSGFWVMKHGQGFRCFLPLLPTSYTYSVLRICTSTYACIVSVSVFVLKRMYMYLLYLWILRTSL